MSNDVDLLITLCVALSLMRSLVRSRLTRGPCARSPHQDGKERGLLRRLCHRLEVKGAALTPRASAWPLEAAFAELTLPALSSRAGFIPPDGILSFSEPATLRSTRENKRAGSFDALDKALVVFKHVANGTTRPKDHYRRVDLIVTRWPSWGAAIVGVSTLKPAPYLRTKARSLTQVAAQWSGSTQFERDLRRAAEKLCVFSSLSSLRAARRRARADKPSHCLAQRVQVRLGRAARARDERGRPDGARARRLSSSELALDPCVDSPPSH